MALNGALSTMFFLNSKELQIMKKKENAIWEVRGLIPVKRSCEPKPVVKDHLLDGDWLMPGYVL